MAFYLSAPVNGTSITTACRVVRTISRQQRSGMTEDLTRRELNQESTFGPIPSKSRHGRGCALIIQNKNPQKDMRRMKRYTGPASHLCMKKLLLVAAVLVGAVSASQAGVHFSIGIGIPLPPPVVIAPPAPVYYPAPVYAPAPVYVPAPPVVCAPPVIVQQPRYYGPRYYPGPGYGGYWHGRGHDRHDDHGGHWNHYRH